MKRSNVFFAGSLAAEAALPPESLALLKAYDAQNSKWLKDKCPHPMPAELLEAQNKFKADPLACAAMEIRVLGNKAAADEWRKERGV